MIQDGSLDMQQSIHLRNISGIVDVSNRLDIDPLPNLLDFEVLFER